MGNTRTTDQRGSGWLWLPLIFGLIIGVAVAAETEQWWWSTVGALAGAAVGAVRAGKVRWPGATDRHR